MALRLQTSIKSSENVKDFLQLLYYYKNNLCICLKHQLFIQQILLIQNRPIRWWQYFFCTCIWFTKQILHAKISPFPSNILLATSLSLSGNVFKKILKIPFNLHFSGAFFGVFQFWVANLRGSLRTYFFYFPKNCFIPNENMNSDDGSFYSERIWKLLILWPHLNFTSWSLLKPGVKNPKSH